MSSAALVTRCCGASRSLARRSAAGVVAVVMIVAFGLLTAGRSQAEYATVTGDLVQWRWAVTARNSAHQVTDVVVRSDGWLVVSTSTFADGYLHVVPPWGGTVDASNRIGATPYGFRQLESRGDRIFGLRQDPQRRGEDTHNAGELLEVDARTGELVKHHGDWWYQDLATDPTSGDLVLQTSGGGREPYRHDLVRYDPRRGSQQVLVRDDEPRSDRAFELAYSPDGSSLFTANVTDIPATIDVRSPDGQLRYQLQSGQVDSLTFGRPGTCFEGLLLITRFDGSVWALRPEEGSAPSPIASGARTAVVSYASLDRDGHLATARYGEVTLVACAGFVPPRAPSDVVPVAGVPVEVAAAVAPPNTPSGPAPPPANSPPAPPAPPAPPPAAAAPAPPAPAAPVAPPGALGTAINTAGAPSVVPAESRDEEHVTSLAAATTSGLPLAVGAVIAMALASYLALAPPPQLRLHRTKGRP